jgi:endonuclease G
MRGTTHQIAFRLLAAGLLGLALTCHAKIGVEYQMLLGDPSKATSNSDNHEHYLIQRTVFAEDYDDRNGEPNWVSWDLTSDDIGPAKRTPAFHADAELPANFHRVTSADYIRSGFDRGHMCPSADRTDNSTDNDLVFAMSNIIPQTKDNNEGVWEHLETDCRTLAQEGNELLIICGPASFSGQHINQNGPMIPSHTWKIIVEVPNGPGSVLSRINSSTRVIAVDIPNTSGVRNDPWTKYLVSVNDLEALTGYHFFTALAPDVAKILKAKVDGQRVSSFTLSATSHSTASSQQLNPVSIALGVVIFLLVLCVIVLVLFFGAKPRR